MSGFELTPQEQENWKKFNQELYPAIKGQRNWQKKKQISREEKKRRQKAIDLYRKTGSLRYTCKNLRMGLSTLKSILKENGVIN